MLKKYLKSIKKFTEDDNLIDGLEGLHMSTTTTELYYIHRDYFCFIRPSWHKDINDA